MPPRVLHPPQLPAALLGVLRHALLEGGAPVQVPQRQPAHKLRPVPRRRRLPAVRLLRAEQLPLVLPQVGGRREGGERLGRQRLVRAVGGVAEVPLVARGLADGGLAAALVAALRGAGRHPPPVPRPLLVLRLQRRVLRPMMPAQHPLVLLLLGGQGGGGGGGVAPPC